jgi:hypothetical protein
MSRVYVKIDRKRKDAMINEKDRILYELEILYSIGAPAS